MASKRKVKIKKSKTSGVKQKNRLRNKGKIKVKRHANKIYNRFNPSTKVTAQSDENKETEAEDVLDMLDKNEVNFLKQSVTNQKYGLLKRIRITKTNQKSEDTKDRRYGDDGDDDDEKMENEYEKKFAESDYNTKMLLPIKTKQGIIRRYTKLNDEETQADNEVPLNKSQKQNYSSSENDGQEEVTWLETEETDNIFNLNEPISIAKIYAKREDAVRKCKLRIGLLSSGLLENPEEKIGNLKHLLDIMSKRDPELQITVKKLVTISLMEVFKDLLPAYQIRHQDIPFNKLKKVTRQLFGYEGELLKGYKLFLTKLEKLAEYLRKKKGDTRIITKQQRSLGILAVRCLCELLANHSYFNYSTNIVQLLTVYLDNPDSDVRKIVEDCYKRIFREDKKRLISLVIVRRINHLVKLRAHSVHCEVLSVLLALPINNINLDKEKEDEIKNKQLMQKKRRVLSMSKRERKRKKELARLENEMLETKAEENKRSKEQHMTEITKVVFLIYFRILKRAPRSNLLSVTLEGLAKFAHCINLEYYQDLMNVLNYLLEKEPLNVREQLYCIKTVFIILSGYGDSLTIDPVHFYTHLYRILLSLNAGRFYDNVHILLSILENVLVAKYKKISTQRCLSFIKRLATVSCTLLHNGTLGCLAIIRSVLQLVKSVDLLLDVESSYGQGIYQAELNEPEYCNAGNTALWELCALRRHYHPTVRKFASSVAANNTNSADISANIDIMKMNAIQFFEQYDPSTGVFKPAVPTPNKQFKTKNVNIKMNTSQYLKNELLTSSSSILDSISVTDVNFSPLLSQNT